MDRRDLILSLPALALAPSLTLPLEKDRIARTLPRRLKEGDKVAIVAPAGAVWNEKRAGEFSVILSNMGLKPVLGPGLSRHMGYLAGSDQERAEEFNSFLCDPEIRGIIAMRGGWGCGRMLEWLDTRALKQDPKVIMGYSDLTSLLNYLTDSTGLVTFHGPVGYSSWNDFTVQHFQDMVMEGLCTVLRSPESFEVEVISSGSGTGPLMGGNLSVITSMIGTKYQPHLRGAILFLEETSEEPYRIDRMLWQLEASGILEQLHGVVIGLCESCQAEEPERSFTLMEVLRQYFSGRDYPVWYGSSFGHIKDKWTLPLGVEACMESESLTLQMLSTAVL